MLFVTDAAGLRDVTGLDEGSLESPPSPPQGTLRYRTVGSEVLWEEGPGRDPRETREREGG